MSAKEIIYKYFNNQLSPEEKVQFDGLMETDAEFREQVEFELKLQKGIFQSEHSYLKQELQAVEKDLGTKKPRTIWYMAAASIIVLVALGLSFFINQDTSESLFKEYYQVANNTSHPIVRFNESRGGETMAFIAYENNDFEEAEVLFDKAFGTTGFSELLFYKAICYLESGDNQLAIDTFEEHINLNDRLLEKSRWYLALTFIKNKEEDQATEILEIVVSNPNHYKFNEAQELLSKL